METWVDKVKISAPRRRRERILLLSLEQDITEEQVMESIRMTLRENEIDEEKEIDVVRKFNTRAGKTNCWDLLCLSFG